MLIWWVIKHIFHCCCCWFLFFFSILHLRNKQNNTQKTLCLHHVPLIYTRSMYTLYGLTLWERAQDLLICICCIYADLASIVIGLAPNSILLHMAMIIWWAHSFFSLILVSHMPRSCIHFLRRPITFVEISKLQIGFHRRKRDQQNRHKIEIKCHIICDKLEANKYKRKFD